MNVTKEQMLSDMARTKRHFPFEVWEAIRDLIDKYGPGEGTTLPLGETPNATSGGPMTPPRDASPGPLSPQDEEAVDHLEGMMNLLDGVNKDDRAALSHLRSRLALLDRAQGLIDRPKIVCFCGSVRFSAEMMIWGWELAKRGIIVLTWSVLPDGYFSGTDDERGIHGAEVEGVREQLDELHKRKIDIADSIYVVNVGGYVGDSTKSEIRYAIDHGKPIVWLEPESKDAILLSLGVRVEAGKE